MDHKKLLTRQLPTSLCLVAVSVIIATCSQSHSPNVLQQTAHDATVHVQRALAPTPAFANKNSGGPSVSIADVAEKVVTGVVNIAATKIVKQRQGNGHPLFNSPGFRDFFGQQFPAVPQNRKENSLGSGVIVSTEGHILTNSHVIDNAEEVIVTLSDGQDFKATIVGSDPKSDIAVLKMDSKPAVLTPLPIGDSSSLRLGEVVIAIGNPFGVGQTVTMGIISAVGRGSAGITDYGDFIQTDAAVNPGNSGGALINMNGEVVGINTAIFSRDGGYQGVSYAIPSNLAKPTMEILLKHGKVVRGWLGVAIQNLSQPLADAMGLSISEGVLVSDVTPASPAATAGFLRGDVIVTIDGKKTINTDQLRNTIGLAGANSKHVIGIWRGGKQSDITVTLSERDDSSGNAKTTTPAQAPKNKLGLEVAPIDDTIRQQLRISSELRHGIVVVATEPSAQAVLAGIRVGDVILEVNRTPIKTASQFHSLVAKQKKLVFLISRNGNTHYVAITP